MEDPALPTPNGIVRALILLILKARWHRPFRSLWRKQTGLFHIFGVCIKVRPDEDLNEAHALQFVSSHTDIPVPKLYYAFTRKGASYIVMEHIEGDMAARGWLSRSEESKTRILGQLRSMINQLRSVKPPAKVGVSNLSGGAFYDCRLPHSLHWGPFTCVREFHQALVRPLGLDDELSFTPEQSDLAELLRFYREAEEKIVLTHGDLSSLNIVVRGDEVAAIVDWETCGWFPSYWEYTCAKYANPLNPFWADEVDRFLDAMPRENEMDTTRRKYFGDF